MICPVCNADTVHLIEDNGFRSRFECSAQHFTETLDGLSGTIYKHYKFVNIRVITRQKMIGKKSTLRGEFTQFLLSESQGNMTTQRTLDVVSGVLSFSEIQKRVARYQKTMVFR